MCQDSLSAFTGNDAVLDGLEVLGVALEEDHPDSGGVKVDTKFHLCNGTQKS